MADLRQILAQGRKRIGLLIGAGGPADIRWNPTTGKLDPKGVSLIPTIDKLTEQVLGSLDEKYSLALNAIKKNIKDASPNIEAILSRVRSFSKVLGPSAVCNLDGDGYEDLATEICKAIGEIVKVSLPAEPNPFSELSAWIGGAQRNHPIEIFTTNYDLLLEESFERNNLPFFDGFVGAHRAFFDPASVASNDLPPRWARIWKLHGSLGWELNSRQEVTRTGSRAATNLIYPDHLKYDQTRKLPYSALLDRLKQFLLGPDTLLITSGFSFSDAHISASISEGLSANPSVSVFAFQYKELAKEQAACALAMERANLSVYAPDGAVINGIQGRGDWVSCQLRTGRAFARPIGTAFRTKTRRPHCNFHWVNLEGLHVSSRCRRQATQMCRLPAPRLRHEPETNPAGLRWISDWQQHQCPTS